ncbi:hypothetical protein [Actinomadura opuntiae]|uniref:hypothetical protein n=1 Tax=Actinomadura sp. OS1-43 TaxID=604315 RepID=UPI00255B3F9D|nr:hypothetical protein [Actinomadura sp. OS1-43]MDL4813377.1 hypothetical protein [Actinomadura sp. OS1-43]
MDELRTLRDAYGEPAPPTMTEIERARARWEGESAPRRFRTRFGRPLGIGLGAVAAGAAAAVAIAATGQGAADGPGSPKAPGDIDLGRRAVLAAATKAEQAPTGRYWYTDRVSGQSYIVRSKSGRPYAIVGAADEMFGWDGVKPGMGEMYYDRDLPARPLTERDAAVWRADGAPSSFRTWSGDHHATYTTTASKWRSSGPGVGLDPEGGGTFFWGKSARELQELPTDPAALTTLVLSDEALRKRFGKKVAGAPRAVERTMTPAAKMRIAGGFLSAPTPPKVRAGLMRALAALPGVHAVARDTDPLGRTGVALAADPMSSTDDGEYGTEKADRGTYTWRSVFVFDERTGALLSMQDELVKPGGVYRTRTPGFIISYETFRSSGWTQSEPKPPAALPFPAR